MADTTLMDFDEFGEFIANNEWLPNYDTANEALPEHPWFGVDPSAISQGLSEASAKILAALGVIPKDDVELRHLERNALDLKHVNRSPAKKIFFMGPAGVGKSSLFNALFNQPGFAKTAAKGDACTSVIVRYSASTSNETDGFSVIIEFLKPDNIKECIAEHSKSYFHRYFDSTEPEDREIDIESSDIKQAETARKFFTLIFGDHDEFELYFIPRTYEDGSFQALCLDRCLSKLSDAGVDQESFTKRQFFRNSEDLLSSIEGYVSDVKDKQCFWHLVDSLEIKCPFPILRQNLEFIDSPGKSLSIYARRQS